MELQDYKKLIGKECVVIDPRSKIKNFQPGTILSVRIGIFKIGEEVNVYPAYEVKLKKLTKSKSRRKSYFNDPSYHRVVTVRKNEIKLV